MLRRTLTSLSSSGTAGTGTSADIGAAATPGTAGGGEARLLQCEYQQLCALLLLKLLRRLLTLSRTQLAVQLAR